MNSLAFLQSNLIQLQQLRKDAADDPILGPQLEFRVEEAEKKLEAARTQPNTLLQRDIVVPPRAAVFIRGGGVEGTQGIRPKLAGLALVNYEGMFVEQAIHDEREHAKNAGRQRRPRGAPTPQLLFTGTPRGSFGLEFIPQPTDESTPIENQAQSMFNVAKALQLFANTDDISTALTAVPRGVVPYLRNFFGVLAEHGAEIRLAFSDKSAISIPAAAIKSAAERLEKQVAVRDETYKGIFRGLTYETGKFDLKMDDNTIISGSVSETLTDEDLDRITALTNHLCEAVIAETTITTATGTTTSYLLTNATPSFSN